MNYLKDIYYWKHLSIIKLKHDDVPATPEDDMMEYLNKWELKGRNVIDGGSNLGLFSMVFSEMIGDGYVYAFELQSLINQIGLENFALNNRKNIHPFNLALSDKSGEKVGFSFIDYGVESVSTTGIRTEPLLSGELHCGEIVTVAIDDLRLRSIGLIKLDIEGYEPQALDGMWKTIDRCKPYLIIELSNGYLGDEGVNKTIEKIKSHGYSVKEISGFNYVCEPIK